MAVTRQRKLAIAERSHELLTGKYGLRREDLIFDPLVFPWAPATQNYVGSAVETIEGIRVIKERFPHCRTILGISNVSFGLPPAGREVLNAVFLYHCTKAGLDFAIVNSEKLERYASIPEEERELAEDLLYCAGTDPVAAFAAHFRGKKKEPRVAAARPAPGRAPGALHRRGLQGRPDRRPRSSAREAGRASRSSTGPLMKGMDEVGRLFNDNELIVAEVLQCAEAMKAAVAHLEPLHGQGRDRRAAKSCSPPSRATSTTSARTSWTSSSPTTATRSSISGIKVPPEDADRGRPPAHARRHRPLGPPGEVRPADGGDGPRLEGGRHRGAAPRGGRRSPESSPRPESRSSTGRPLYAETR